ncbi:hypothetical protein TP47_01980 [Xanthomonas citri pv. aurantifolii]|nr:hypothetical protein TP37_22970 [Xanthomonas citri pv. aurantifolii]AMV04937.1 hypothetical protein TP50_22780 [Xanthomonas citri pv. aurantifolii]TBW98341.1 hypothetical protein TP49_07435 [Xanthomonas citri pv. aurantifolii]TBX00919.1 hypothetical protein TP47_01980 [Xanthomonas citri pv. aurantifolii]TBX05377.1 hypothetical protein TP46_00020 [Xanthomonas citri pv. aurantifolii]
MDRHVLWPVRQDAAADNATCSADRCNSAKQDDDSAWANLQVTTARLGNGRLRPYCGVRS